MAGKTKTELEKLLSKEKQAVAKLTAQNIKLSGENDRLSKKLVDFDASAQKTIQKFGEQLDESIKEKALLMKRYEVLREEIANKPEKIKVVEKIVEVEKQLPPVVVPAMVNKARVMQAIDAMAESRTELKEWFESLKTFINIRVL